MSQMYWEKGTKKASINVLNIRQSLFQRSCLGSMRKYSSLLFLLLMLQVFYTPEASAHGSVSPDDDICIIQIGFYRAHFKIFQPQSSGRREFCEDLPRSGESIFVMEYLHQELANVLIDFRIIRNVTGLGRFARLSDLENIDELDEHTVFYQPASIEPGVFTVMHELEERGDYIGIVTVTHPLTGQSYTAVFPFRVGFMDLGLLPLFLLLAILAQLAYKYGSRIFTGKRKQEIDSGENFDAP